jgi:ribosomal protein S18 acetylase RimI-like enzyme
MTELIIRNALLKDLTKIVEFNLRMAKETENKNLDASAVHKGVRALINDPHKGFYLVAEKPDEGIVGQLMVTFEWSDWRNKWFWWIQSVYIQQKYRNQKVFSDLYNYLKELAMNSNNVYGIRLYVEKDNLSAKLAYTSLGLIKTSYEMFESRLGTEY